MVSGLHVLHTSSPMGFHSDAGHKRCQKYDTHILSDNQIKEIPKEFYIDNALQPSFAMQTALSIPFAWGRYSLLTLDFANPLETKSTKYLSLSVFFVFL